MSDFNFSNYNLDARRLNSFLSPEKLQETFDLKPPEKSQNSEQIDSFIENYLKYSVNTSHKMYCNQLWSKVSKFSILGEKLAAQSNTSMYTYEVAPVATLLEKSMVKYLSEKIWPEAGDGLMTSGGAMSNLQALLVARNLEDAKIQSAGLQGSREPLVFFAAKNCHYSLYRSANILGLGQENLIEVKTDPSGHMLIEDLEKKIQLAKKENKKPFCVISTSGTTVEGSFDDLEKIGLICKSQNIWLHVDGAYGASFLLSQKHKSFLKGIEQADSVSWDFHKILGVNLPCAFLFTKEKGLLRKTLMSGQEDYLFHDQKESLNLGNSSIQCGRKNDILKLWLTWMSVGQEGFEKRLDTLVNLSKDFADLIDQNPNLDLLFQPISINICFRLNSKFDSNMTYKVREDLLKSGQLMINYSEDQQGAFFRLALTNPELTKEDLAKMLDLIVKKADDLQRNK